MTYYDLAQQTNEYMHSNEPYVTARMPTESAQAYFKLLWRLNTHRNAAGVILRGNDAPEFWAIRLDLRRLIAKNIVPDFEKVTHSSRPIYFLRNGSTLRLATIKYPEQLHGLKIDYMAIIGHIPEYQLEWITTRMRTEKGHIMHFLT